MNRSAVLCVQGWIGYGEEPCRVVGETPKRYRITVDAPTVIRMCNWTLTDGGMKLVPKSAIKFTDTPVKESRHERIKPKKAHRFD